MMIVNEPMLPLYLKKSESFSDEEFLAFCVSNPDLRIERDAEGNILIMAPTHTHTGEQNSNLLIEFGIWNKKHKRGKVFDSSSGFTLRNKAVRAPDVSFILNETLNKLSAEEKTGFYKVCPDFVLELKSPTDKLADVKAKMQEYIANGATFGWLINPDEQKVYIYNEDGSIAIHDDFNEPLYGRHFMSDFEINLAEVLK